MTNERKREPLHVIGPSIAYIPLTRGQFACVDSDAESLVFSKNWVFLPKSGRRIGYAAAQHAGKTTYYLHRMVMNDGSEWVDHINGNGLDNRRANLRFATPSQNAGNSVVYSTSTTGVRGVRLHAGKYEASIGRNESYRYLGRFSSLEEAKVAYEKAAKEHFGAYALGLAGKESK